VLLKLSDHRMPSSSSSGWLLLQKADRAPPVCLWVHPHHMPSSAATQQSRAGKQPLLWDQQDSAFYPIKAHSLAPPDTERSSSCPRAGPAPAESWDRSRLVRGRGSWGTPLMAAAAAPACSFGWQLCAVVFAHSHQPGGQLAQKTVASPGNPSTRDGDRCLPRPPAIPRSRGSVVTPTCKSPAKAQSCSLPRKTQGPSSGTRCTQAC